jgi:predicted signal transduction protein with EAL and GGDEF domain
MSQSKRIVRPTRMTGVIAAAFTAWSFLVWTIWKVFVGA